MRRFLIVAALTVATGVSAGPSAEIDADALLGHVKYLSTDEMKGRANGSPELERAGEYIAQQFKAAGLQPGGANGDWFQPFELTAGLNVGKGNSLTIEYRGKGVPLSLG